LCDAFCPESPATIVVRMYGVKSDDLSTENRLAMEVAINDPLPSQLSS